MLKGARQVGKTYIVKDFIDKEFGSSLIIDFHEQLDMSEIFEGDLDAGTILNRIRVRCPSFQPIPGNTAILLDEIQFCPNARTALKYLAQCKDIKVVASWSQDRTVRIYVHIP